MGHTILTMNSNQSCLPDIPSDLHPVRPSGELRGGRARSLKLHYYSIRQQVDRVRVSFYTRKLNQGYASYGITITPAIAKEIGSKLIAMAEKVMVRMGKPKME